MISKEFILKKIAQVLLHSIFWIAVLFCYTYFFGYNTQDINYVFSFSLFLMPVTMGTTYTVIDILIPRYLLQEKYRLFILYCVYTIIISAYFIVISFFYGLIFLTETKIGDMAPMTRSPLFLFIAVYFVVFIASALDLTRHNYKSNTANQKLQTKILETQLKLKEQELRYLKMQIHPHFLFNTLNTMYGFAIKKSEETPELILKLSNLLDYLLYQSDKPLVSLDQEIEHIYDYIALEKMRFRDSLEISLQIEDTDSTIEIAPMLFIPFVENSFKHGQLRNGKLHISIELSCNNTELLFKIKNSVHADMGQESSGIGLKNIQKRLDLLYPENYQLDIARDHDWYTVTLSIKVSKLNLHEH
ncbi:histidine kinase [Aquimarina sp. D1M17]|uniref:sensor histidine kinase n=1 Tax=Aquimarina acroporae TaxID=2937283 RepID=UPI0020C03DC8|nr:histidine kinase [Aquimarina acroporae]MCK8524038.1 histidine kinase [Aquimarina acroporae]